MHLAMAMAIVSTQLRHKHTKVQKDENPELFWYLVSIAICEFRYFVLFCAATEYSIDCIPLERANIFEWG